MTKPKLRKNAEINPPQSPHDGIHTCSKGCKKPGCTRTLRDTIEEQDKQIEALKRDVLEKTAELRKKAMETIHDINHIGGLQEENARLKAEVEARQKDMNEMFREIKEGREAYQRLHHLYLTAREGKQP